MLVAYLCLVVNVFALESLDNEFKDDYDYSTWKNPFDGGLGNLKSDKDNTEKSDVANEKLDKKLNTNAGGDPCDEAKVQEMKNLIKQLKDKTESSDHLKQCDVPKQSNIPYFKHFLSSFTSFVHPGGDFGDYYVTQIKISSHRYSRLQKLLDLENSEKELLDIMTESFEHFSHPNNSTFWRDTFIEQLWPGLIFVVGLCFCFIIWKSVSSWDLFLWRRNIILVVFFCFLLSIPWEWYRMYKGALSKKTAASLKDIPHECSPNKMTAWNSIRLWFKDLLSTTPDQCAMYYEAILVDPIWEVSPLMATSASLSRFCGEPLKQLAATSGECFKLFFNEIPMQWQPIVFAAVFVLLIVLIFSLSGFEISTPLLRIGSKNVDASKIKQIYDEQIRSLQEKNEKLQLMILDNKENNTKKAENKNIDDISYDDQLIRYRKKTRQIQTSMSSGFDRPKVQHSIKYASEPLLQNLTPIESIIDEEANALNDGSNVDCLNECVFDTYPESRASETEWPRDVKHPSVGRTALRTPHSINNVTEFSSSRFGENENPISNVGIFLEINGNDRESHVENDYILVDQ